MKLARWFVMLMICVGLFSTTVDGQSCIGGTNSALSFDGVNDVVKIPDSAALDGFVDFTIEFWFRSTLASVHQVMISKYRGNGAGVHSDDAFVIETNSPTDNRVRATIVHMNTVTTLFSSSSPSGDGIWHHLAFVRSSSVLSLLMDGVVETTTTQSAPMNTVADALLIGAMHTSAGQPVEWFNGSIDEVRIWNVARTQAQIQASMNTTLIGGQSGLVGYWRCDDGASSTTTQVVIDLSSTAANGVRGATGAVAADDPNWTTTDVPPIIYAGSGGLIGQANSSQARLEINGVGAGTSQGPFFVTIAPGGTLSFVWTGDPSQPCILLMGPLNVANTVNPLIGTVDIGTPCLAPAFSDVIVLFDGTSPSYSNFFTTNGTGTTIQTFMLPVGLPSGPLMTVQGVMGNTTSAFPFHMTAAFQIVL